MQFYFSLVLLIYLLICHSQETAKGHLRSLEFVYLVNTVSESSKLRFVYLVEFGIRILWTMDIGQW